MEDPARSRLGSLSLPKISLPVMAKESWSRSLVTREPLYGALGRRQTQIFFAPNCQ
jgi:hypothetical protein